MPKHHHYFLFYKPYGVLSQFTDEDGHKGIGNFISVPKSVYPIGRLDLHSEGLLLLTSNRGLTEKLLNPKSGHARTYLAQVDGQVTNKALKKLEKGVSFTAKGKSYTSLPAKAKRTQPPEKLPEGAPIAPSVKQTDWIKLTLQEGKNRQVRKMTAAVGFPTLRLIRVGIEELSLFPLKPGEIQEVPERFFLQKLHL